MVGTMIESSSCSASTSTSTSTSSSSSSSSGGGCAGSAPRSAACLKRAGPMAVPETVAWLDHLTLELRTASVGGKPQYQLTMKLSPAQQKLAATAACWTISRSFDEYRAFQKRLLKRMQHGHSCGAECKWLYKVVKHYFPQKSLFCNKCPKVVAARQQTLIRCLTTVQASLVNRGNHVCRVLVHDVAAEFNRFVVKGMKDMDSPSSELSAVTRDSLDSLSEEEDDDSESENEQDGEQDEEEESECDACHSRHVVCRTHSHLKA